MDKKEENIELDILVDRIKELPPNRIPAHIAIIMDGNGRWAKKRNLPRNDGHRAGVTTVRKIVEFAPQVNVKVLTLYTFSTENWRRPKEEVLTLMKLLKDSTLKELDDLVKNSVKLQVFGRFEQLPGPQKMVLRKAMKKTASGSRLTLNLALNYGGRAEIVDTVQKIAKKVATNEIHPDEIDESYFEKNLYTAGFPDPDLLIRTSGELRLSNFLLWQTAYTELYFTDLYWPDFDEKELCRAIISYAGRQRRFGGIASEKKEK